MPEFLSSEKTSLEELCRPPILEKYPHQTSKPAKTGRFVFRAKKGISLILLLFLVFFIAAWLKIDRFSSNDQEHLIHLKGVCSTFIGREKYLSTLYKDLLGKDNLKELRHSVKIKVLWGKGGVGKSELATMFANRYSSQFSLIWTFWCDQKEQLEQGYRLLADRLGIAHSQEPIETLQKKVHSYLENNSFKRPWLLIFDNIEEELSHYPTKGGIILLTSQKKIFDSESLLEVSPFSKEESIQLIEKITKENRTEEMEHLAEDLDYIPLLINYAAHYIESTPGLTVQEYRRLFSSYLLEKEGPLWKEGDAHQGYFKSLVASWQFPLKSLEKENPLALKWLFVSSYLYPEFMSEEWIKDWLLQEVKIEKQTAENESKEILTSLLTYGIIRYDEKTNTFSLHRFLQYMIRESRQKEAIDDLSQAIALLEKHANDFRFEDSSSWALGKFWYLHACAVRKWLDIYSSRFAENEAVLKQAVLYEGISKWSRYNDYCYEALAADYKALELRKTAFQQNSCEIALRYTCISRSLQRLARYPESIDAANKALEIYEQLLDKKSLNYALALRAKGMALYDVGKYEEALEYCKETLQIREKGLGKSHYDVAISLTNLGQCLRELGQTQEALALFEKVIPIFQKTCGNKHPSYANALGNKAKTLMYQERYTEAIPLFKQSISLYSFTIHSVTKAYQYNRMGICYLKLKKYKKAREMFKMGLQIGQEVYGENNRIVIYAYNGIGWSYLKEKNVVKGLKYLLLHLEIGAKVFQNYPKMIENLEDFKQALTEAKQLGGDIQAAALAASKISRETVGKDHPLTNYFQTISDCL